MTRKSRRELDNLSTPSMQEVIELLHDSPLDAGLTDLEGISSKLDQVLSELHRVTNMVGNITVGDANLEVSGKGDTNVTIEVNQEVDALTNQVEKQLVETVTDVVTADNPLLGETLKMLYEANAEQWRHLGQKVRDLIMHIDISNIRKNVKGIKREISGVFGIDNRTKAIEGVTRQTLRLTRDIENKLDEVEHTLNQAVSDINEKVISKLSSLEELSLALQESIVGKTDEIKDLLAHYNNANMTWFNAIYDKLEECCVKDDVMSLIDKSDAIKNELDEVKRRLNGQPSPRDQSIEGETRSALKAIQAQLAEIRGLL